MATRRRRDGRGASTAPHRPKRPGGGRLPSAVAGLALVALVANAACATGPRGEGTRAREDAAAAERTVRLDVRDAATGRPVGACAVVGWRGAGGRATKVTPAGMHRADDGRHRFVVPADVTAVELAADGYADAWASVAPSAAPTAVGLRLR